MKLTWGRFFAIELWLTVTGLLLLGAGPTLGIVLHPDGEPNPATWTDRPDANVVGQWSSNASFVVIAPNWIVTTRHQGTSPSTVVLNGLSYTCIYKTEWTGGPVGNADIRLIRLTKGDGSNANLPNYARPYESGDEVGKDIIIGGYGNGRGSSIIITFHGKDYVVGYNWDNESTNITQRWCQNIVDSNTVHTLAGYTSEIIKADFDGLGDDDYRPYEGIIARFDSGGGWFINDSGEWKVSGLSRATESAIAYASTFKSLSDPRDSMPDKFDAVRISSYAQWIRQIILAGDLTGDEWADFADFALFANQWMRSDCNTANNWCDGADFIPHNGSVDWNDLSVFSDHWLTGWEY